MIDAFRTVTLRSLLRTAAFGKPDATPAEKRNYMRWGHTAPSPEHKLLVLLLGALAAALAAFVMADRAAVAAEDLPAQPAMRVPAASVIIIAPLA